MDSYVDLDVVGVLQGTDKSSCVKRGWDYLRHYERYFAPYRNLPISLVEIGVLGGVSLAMWEWYFPHAVIVGVDIDENCRGYEAGRIRIEIGSQADTDFMSKVCDAHRPSIVIDDGSHRAEHMIVTFEAVFPLISPGGLYVIEDFAFHAGNTTRWQTQNYRDVVGYYTDLSRSVLAPATAPAPGCLLAQIDSITMIRGAVLIRKRAETRDVARAVDTAHAFMRTHVPGPGTRERLAEYILHHGGPLDRAEGILDEALAAEGESANRLRLKAHILISRDRADEARALLRQASSLAGAQVSDLRRITWLQNSQGDLAGAIETATRACDLAPQDGSLRKMRENIVARARVK